MDDFIIVEEREVGAKVIEEVLDELTHEHGVGSFRLLRVEEVCSENRTVHVGMGCLGRPIVRSV